MFHIEFYEKDFDKIIEYGNVDKETFDLIINNKKEREISYEDNAIKIIFISEKIFIKLFLINKDNSECFNNLLEKVLNKISEE
jgi:hypothetical protein